MDRSMWLAAGLGALAGFVAGIFVGRTSGRRAEPAPQITGATRSLEDGLRSVETDDMVAVFRRQEDAVRKAIVELTMSLGTPGADQIGLTGKIAGLTAELTKIESRRHIAEADAAAIPFPSKAKVDQLRDAVGALETAIGKAVAVQQLLEKTSAAIEAWKA